jgi:hypothetical protein
MKKFKLDANADSFPGCPETYYCEYMCVGGSWYIVNANAQSGYYCPATINLAPADDGTVVCDPTYPTGRTAPAFAEADGDHFVEYEVRDGKFQVSKANCPVGYHAPLDPIEFAKKYGKLRIYPAKLDPQDGTA